MTLNIEFDFSFDSAGFYDDPRIRATLEASARVWEGLIRDEFADIPAGTTFTIENPTTGAATPVTLSAPIDDLRIYVGTRDMGYRPALAFPTGQDATGDVLQSRVTENFRGAGPTTDFEPWAGWLALNPNAFWHVDHTAEVTPGAHDLLTHVVHQLAHILGFGTSPTFLSIGAGAQFDGPNALVVNDGQPIPLGLSLGHVVEGFAGSRILMDPNIPRGERLEPTPIDLALLSDIGYEIDGFAKQGTPFAISTDGDEVIVGQDVGDVLNARAGNDTVFAGPGADLVFGGDGTDHIHGGYGNDTLHGGGAADTINGGFGVDALIGNSGNDVLAGAAFSDHLFGNDGDDFLNGGYGSDLVNGGAGADRFFHLGVRGHGTDWLQDYAAGEGDVLLFGLVMASDADFLVTYAHAADRNGERAGDDDVMEAFLTYRPTAQIIWALVDGVADSALVIRSGGTEFDLLG